MPWARISRVTFARSTTSGEGLHTNVTACPASYSGLRVRSGARERRGSRSQPMTSTNPTTPGATGPVDIAGRCDEHACNYLLLGSDSRKGLTREEIIAFGTNAHIGGENRSDTIILVHTRPDRKEAIFLSFPRDLWVDIPGRDEGKINSAFEGGIDG